MNRKKLLIGLLSIGVVSATAISASASKLDTNNIKGDVKFVESIDQASEDSESTLLSFDLTTEEAKAIAEKEGLKFLEEINIEGDFETFDLTNPEEAKAIAEKEGFQYLEEVNMEGNVENAVPFDLTTEEAKAIAEKEGIQYLEEVNIEGDFETFDLTSGK